MPAKRPSLLRRLSLRHQLAPVALLAIACLVLTLSTTVVIQRSFTPAKSSASEGKLASEQSTLPLNLIPPLPNAPGSGAEDPTPTPTSSPDPTSGPTPTPTSSPEPTSTPTPTPSPTTGSAGPLPFDPPASSAGDQKLAFAHYFTPFLDSVDNKPADSDYYTKQWLTPDGEKGKHKAYGGFLRDRPLPLQPMSSSDYQSADMQTDIKQAEAGGLNGFTLDILSASPSSYNYKRDFMMLDAAAATDPASTSRSCRAF